jgi:excinuclease ABC subunit B
MTAFNLKADFAPTGSQPGAINDLVGGIGRGERFQTLLGVTGSGKTFTIANVIEEVQKPTLVVAHNKTLAAQLYNEFKSFFPENRVEYFVSYYDYYQPESYIAKRDLYIEKDAQINPKIEQMRLAATASVLSRPDTIIVASVSCIYGLGNPANFQGMGFEVKVRDRMRRDDIIRRLIGIQFERNDIELAPGRFRVKGDTIDIVPGYFNNIIRIELFGDEVDRISEIDRNSGQRLETMDYFFVYPARHFVAPEEEKERAIVSIQEELEEWLPNLGMLEAHRLRQRTLYDIDMIRETGTCKGIENYSRHFDGRKAGEKPYCLLDYFPEDFLMVIDESHQTLPQVRGMYHGDYSRKKSLVDYGFRLPSAFDNRPLKFDEFSGYMQNVIFVSATPGDYELERSTVTEQIIRPTGLVDPAVEVRPIEGQIPDVIAEIRTTIERGDRVLLTTLTKRLAEELSEYLAEQGIKTRYLHSEINTIERTEIIRQLRLGKYDVLVGINLLREGLDIPEVGLVGILDADKEGFLRDARSLVQTIGRAARNVNAKVVLYADTMTDSIKKAMAETERRRVMQVDYNVRHGITPQTVRKPIREREVDITDVKHVPKQEIPNLIIELEAEMQEAAERLEFERAIALRDTIRKLQGGGARQGSGPSKNRR